MSALALDIGTYTIKAVQGKTGNQIEVERVAEVFNSLGFAVPSDEASIQKMAEFVDAVLSDHKLPRTDIRLSLPETVVSTKLIELPVLSDAELASAIGWQAEQHIPIPPEQLSLQYQVVYRPPKKTAEAKMRVLLIGAHKDIVNRYVEVFVALGIEPKILETQILSILRAIQLTAQEPPTLIVNIGASSTQLAMVYEGELRFVTSHMTGGQVLTQTLERQIQLDSQQAEQYKRSYGLIENQLEGKVRQVLLPAVNIMVTEIKKALTFFHNQYPQAAHQRILLAGGGSLLPGLVQHITDQAGVEVLVAAPFANATGEIPEGGHPVWTVCTGLLMREET